MSIINGYISIGCQDGTVKFYDLFLRIEAWFEDLAAGPIKSLSYASQDNPFPEGDVGIPGYKFWVPDFIVIWSFHL